MNRFQYQPYLHPFLHQICQKNAPWGRPLSGLAPSAVLSALRPRKATETVGVSAGRNMFIMVNVYGFHDETYWWWMASWMAFDSHIRVSPKMDGLLHGESHLQNCFIGLVQSGKSKPETMLCPCFFPHEIWGVPANFPVNQSNKAFFMGKKTWKHMWNQNIYVYLRSMNGVFFPNACQRLQEGKSSLNDFILETPKSSTDGQQLKHLKSHGEIC